MEFTHEYDLRDGDLSNDIARCTSCQQSNSSSLNSYLDEELSYLDMYVRESVKSKCNAQHKNIQKNFKNQKYFFTNVNFLDSQELLDNKMFFKLCNDKRCRICPNANTSQINNEATLKFCKIFNCIYLLDLKML